MAEKNIEEFAKFLAEEKGKRKFKQTVELAINFRGIDFTRQDNRLKLDVLLPNSKGKERKTAIFTTDKTLMERAQKIGIIVLDGENIDGMAKDAAMLNKMLGYELVAQPNLMPQIAKSLGQFLGPRNKMPKPLLGNIDLETIAAEASRRISIRNKGKFLPTIHCIVGSEDMPAEKIYQNIDAVVNAVGKQVGSNRIRSVYAKLTMSKPFRIS